MSDKNYRLVRGMKDLCYDESRKYDFIISTAKSISQKYNFEYLITPVLEYSNLFERNLGDQSDVVSKEIYKFEDKGGDSVALRPEFTASVGRFIIENAFYYGPFPRKYFSFGNLYRYDRPQKGRQREFNQINFEIFGVDKNYYLLYLKMAQEILNEIGVESKLELNHLGNKETRIAYENELKAYLLKYFNDLSFDSQRRLETNVLRILDSKEEKDKEILKDAPKLINFLSIEDKEFLSELSEKLNATINPQLVRGLDYYTGLVFEFQTDQLGSQSAIGGGGEYNDFIYKLSGNKHNLNAFGFAMGIERLMLLLKQNVAVKDNLCVILNILQDNQKEICLKDLDKKILQNHNIKRFETLYVNNLNEGLKNVQKLKGGFALFYSNNTIVMKNMTNGEQFEI